MIRSESVADLPPSGLKVLKAALSDADRDEIMAKLGHIGGQIAGDIHLIQQTLKAPVPPMNKLAMLLNFAAGNGAPLGPVSDQAKAEVMRLPRVGRHAHALGPEAVFHQRHEIFPRCDVRMHGAAGRGADVILDVLGGPHLARHLDLLAPDGRLVVIGLLEGREGTVDLRQALGKRLTLTNHPIGGPIFSGPQVTPYACNPNASNPPLGPAVDAQCNAPTRV